MLNYVSGGEILILIDGKSWDIGRSKIRGTRLAFIHIIKESFKNWNLLIILFFVTITSSGCHGMGKKKKKENHNGKGTGYSGLQQFN